MRTPEEDLDRQGSVLAHTSALLGLIVPFGQVLGPYLTRLLLPPRAAHARGHATEALNFQIQMLLLLPNLYAFGMALRAATEASRGRAFRYPFVFRVLRPVPVTPGGGLGELLDRGEIIPFVVRDLAAARRFYVDQLRLLRDPEGYLLSISEASARA